MTLMRISPLAAVLAVALVAATANAGKYNAVLSIGDAMPAFSELPSVDGSALSSADLKADVIILVSLANHCPWVKGMDRDLVKLVAQFEGKSVQVVGFSINRRDDDRLPAMKEHAKRVGYEFSYVYDESQALGLALGATRTPEYFVFGPDRKLAYMGLIHDSPAKMNRDGSVRHINGDPGVFYVADAIKALLAGKPVEVTETRAHGCTAKYEI